jgi:hypothetical protein
VKREWSQGRAKCPTPKTAWIVQVITFALLLGGCWRVNTVMTTMSDCLNSSYERYTYHNPTTITDADPAGNVIGPVRIPAEGGLLHGVILCLNISHKRTADLDLWLRYDADNDGKPEASAPVEFYRGRTDGCAAREPYACPMALQGSFWFRDDGVGGPDHTFAVFNGLARGGSFYLAVSDTLAKDVGTITNWSVYVEKTTQLACR